MLGPEDYLGLIELAGSGDLIVGAVYDALVAFTAKRHDRRLVTMDARARSTYDAVGAPYQLL